MAGEPQHAGRGRHTSTAFCHSCTLREPSPCRSVPDPGGTSLLGPGTATRIQAPHDLQAGCPKALHRGRDRFECIASDRRCARVRAACCRGCSCQIACASRLLRALDPSSAIDHRRRRAAPTRPRGPQGFSCRHQTTGLTLELAGPSNTVASFCGGPAPAPPDGSKARQVRPARVGT